MGIELERHPPERGTLPVVVAGGCCTTCCCCCCCCAYVVGGLAGAAIGTAIARSTDERAKGTLGGYWSLVGWTVAASVVLGLVGFAVPMVWVPAGLLLLLGVPVAQLLGSLILLLKRDPIARRAGVKVTLAWLALTLLGVWITMGLVSSCADSSGG